MAEYHLTPEVAIAIRREIFKKMLRVGLLGLIGSFCYSYFILKGDLLVALSTCGLLLGAVIYGYFRGVKQQQVLAASYHLLITSAAITRTQAPLPTIQLTPSEITSITQNHAGVLTIAAVDKYRSIYVPVYITDRDELLRELAFYAPLTVLNQKTLLERAAPLAGIAMLALMGTFYSVTDKVTSTSTGVLLLGLLAWSGWHIWRNPNLPPQVRLMRWFLPIVFLSVLVGVMARLQQ